MGIYVDRVKEGLSTLKDNKELEQEYLDEYKKRKSMIEATFENDALGRNVLKAIDDNLIPLTKQNIDIIEQGIIKNEGSMISYAKQIEYAEEQARIKRELENNQNVTVDDNSGETFGV